MKNKFTLAAFFIIFLLFSSSVQAVKFDDNQTVESNKTWTIKFSDDVEFDDATKQGITVRDSSGTEVNVGIQLGQDRKTVTVTAPELGYTPGENYMLNIGNKVHSSNGKLLNNGCNVNFCIENSTNSGPIVTFKDKNLEQAIRNKINKLTGDLYESNVDKITQLDIEYSEIENISGIENLINLRMIDLRGNKISDISALKNLTNLKQLSLGGNKFSDISALKNLVNLQMLNLDSTKVNDISALSGISNLQTLDLSDNKISDISGLKGLTNLKMLDLSYNQISDVSVFKNLRDLRWLALFDNPISEADIQSLKNMLPSCEINEVVAKKPNIYLYPEKTEGLTVHVTPKGKITKSIPEYNEGWKVIVEPSGKIDNAYDFLFYEASLNYKFTLNKGWIINKDSFNEEMSSILTSIGLNSKEKADFIEYWSKELKWQSSRYAVYYLDPKEINEAIKLNLSKEPDSILRAYFYFVPIKDNENLEIKEPEIKEFKRNGFTVVEWGGIGK